ncbi:MAG: hypothetical protein AAF997_15905 [Myxococcota bacterium]
MGWYLRFAVAVFVAVLALADGTSAQFLEDRSSNEGPGFKTGRFVLHPGLAIEGGYDDNVFLQDNGREDSFILRLTGYLDFATMSPQRMRDGESNDPEPQKITFRGGLGVRYLHYFNDRNRNNVGGDAHFDFAYNPSKVFSLEVGDRFLRTVQPFSNPDTAEGDTTSFGQNINNARIDFVGRSRSQVLEGRLGYGNQFQFFDSELYQYADSVTHRVPGQLAWRFFPTSAILWNVEYAHQHFRNPELIALSPTLLNDSNRVRSEIGYNGALTDRLSLTAMIGYAAGFYDVLEDFDDVIARVEARWAARPTITIAGGYTRDVVPSFIGNFTELHRLHFNAEFIAAGALTVAFRSWVSFDKSGLALQPDGSFLGNQPRRKDIRTRVGVWGEYRFRSWISVFAEVFYLADFTDFVYLGIEPLVDPPGQYQKIQAWLGIRVFY